MNQSQEAERLGLLNVVSRIEGGRNIPAGIIRGEDTLAAGIVETRTDDVWYIEKHDTGVDNHAYRAIVLRPHSTRKLTYDPQNIARGKWQSEQFQSCQAFVFNVPTEEIEDIKSESVLASRLSSLFQYGINQQLVEKRRVHSDGELVSLYDQVLSGNQT